MAYARVLNLEYRSEKDQELYHEKWSYKHALCTDKYG